MKKKSLLLCLLTAAFFSHAQNVAINNTGTPPNASAMLDITSSSKGLLIPRVVLTATTDNKGMLSVNYSGLISVLIESIKVQQKKIEKLARHDKVQQQQIDELKKLVEKLLPRTN